MKKVLLAALAAAFATTLASAGLGFIGSHVAVAIYLVLITFAGVASIYVAENSGARSRI